jgi:hypothetical protein
LGPQVARNLTQANGTAGAAGGGGLIKAFEVGATALAPAVTSSVVIFIFSIIYNKLGFVLTSWENHRTEGEYQDALITKLFVFQFVNQFSGLFYIAFFRGVEMPRNGNTTGLFGVDALTDECPQGAAGCMRYLSVQVLAQSVILPALHYGP